MAVGRLRKSTAGNAASVVASASEKTLQGLPRGRTRAQDDAEVAIKMREAAYSIAQRVNPKPHMAALHQKALHDLRVDAKLRGRLEAVGSRRTEVRPLKKIEPGAEAENLANIVRGDQEAMILSMHAVLEWVRERGELAPHHCDNLMAIYEGLVLTYEQEYFYAFQPTNPKGKRVRENETALWRRANVAAMVPALIEVGKNRRGQGKQWALEVIATAMRDARRSDFALSADEEITPAMMSNWYGDFTRRRGTKGSLDGTAAKACFERLVTREIPERAKEGPAALEAWARSMLSSTISRVASAT